MLKKYAYLIESLAPLVFRSGKPFGAQSSAQDVVFPLPSSAAGLIRAISIEQDSGQYQDYGQNLQHADYQQLLRITAQGPFLARFNPDHDQYTVLVPKPANALYFTKKDSQTTQLVRLAPQAFDAEQGGSDLPDGLLPVQMQQTMKGKPQSGPAYWSLAHVLQWQQGQQLSFEAVSTEGLSALPIDIRTHVALDDLSLASEDGKLFQTASFDLGHQVQPQGGWSNARYGFLVLSAQDLQQDLATFGGERRLSYIRPVKPDALLTRVPDDLANQINQASGFCLTLLTPAIFAQGYLPAWIDPESFTGTLPGTKVQVQLKAAAIERWLPVSGWDSIVWKPKASRKAVSAGSVYWFSLLGPMDQGTVEQLWASPLSDHLQDQRDGFGMQILAAWNQ